jgi:hypothetical protein
MRMYLDLILELKYGRLLQENGRMYRFVYDRKMPERNENSLRNAADLQLVLVL